MDTGNKGSCLRGCIRRSRGHPDTLSSHPPPLSTGVAPHTWVRPRVWLPSLEK